MPELFLKLTAQAGTCVAGIPSAIPLQEGVNIIGRGDEGAACLNTGAASYVQLNLATASGRRHKHYLWVSRQHAQISVVGSAVTLTDLSSNGIMVDGVAVSKGAEAALRAGSVVVFGTRSLAADDESTTVRQRKQFLIDTLRYTLCAAPASPAEAAGAEAAGAAGVAAGGAGAAAGGAEAAAAATAADLAPAATPAAVLPAAVLQALSSLRRVFAFDYVNHSFSSTASRRPRAGTAGGLTPTG